MIVERWHHLELCNAEMFRFLPRLDVDFVQCFDMFGHERYRNNQQALSPLCRHFVDCVVEGRLQPFCRSDFTLKTETVWRRPFTPLHDQSNRFFNLQLVRVAAVNQTDRHAVSTEDQIDILRVEVRKFRIDLIDILNDALYIEWMIVITAD